MKANVLLATVVVVSFSACAASAPRVPNRAAVVIKLNESEGHICMGIGEVSPGDRVTLYKNQCTRPTGSKQNVATVMCKKMLLGEGEVVRALNEHYSVLRVDPGVEFEEGTMVEKKRS